MILRFDDADHWKVELLGICDDAARDVDVLTLEGAGRRNRARLAGHL
jgi:hypothetical protein